MKKNNKITALIVTLFIVIVIIISAIFIYKKLTYREVILSIDDVIEVNNKVQAGESIDFEYFKDYKLIKEDEKNGMDSYMYEMVSKYEFEVDVINDKIVAMFLINKVTYDYVNILEDSLEEFLQFN